MPLKILQTCAKSWKFDIEYKDAGFSKKCCCPGKQINHVVLLSVREANQTMATIESAMQTLIETNPTFQDSILFPPGFGTKSWSEVRDTLSTLRCRLLSKLQNVTVAEQKPKCLLSIKAMKYKRKRIDCE